MVCGPFVGSHTFPAVASYPGGGQMICQIVEGLNLTPVRFPILAWLVIVLPGGPLDWPEIVILFAPSFLPLPVHFEIDTLFFGILVALDLPTSFLTPPMAMPACSLKDIAHARAAAARDRPLRHAGSRLRADLDGADVRPAADRLPSARTGLRMRARA
ncbi:TRAP transporter large permease subunit [Rhodovulum sp. MB263]|uniref:TRAP transporter large permease subunit n=1 Tax=Rhodovulum sp. (strain MB263) TaxID=308754 RepID=UPI001E37FA56|nr:TRAP transporter large permease subunit [Rhodovulum sp. MB263]